MSSGPLETGEALLETYLKYLKTPFSIRYSSLSQEREALLKDPGRIFQKPFVEYLPGYKRSGLSLEKITKEMGLGREVGNFLKAGLFPQSGDIDLFTHQVDAFKLAMKPLDEGGKHVVVTSGTGSGKTECFLMPVIARLLDESKDWDPPTGKPRYWWRKNGSFTPKRSHENRPAAIRALFLYPLNALVEDQMRKLRRALDSKRAKSRLDSNRSRNRFYFGSYFGRTPRPGKMTDRKMSDLKRFLNGMEEERKALPEDAQDLLPDPAGSEMVTRWDMQEHPPDILVTNYSMLNIMLMRSIERSIFNKTRKWLQSDKNNVFTLVLDELHSYRGTPGTEIALVIRLLLDRLALSPDSPQLRIIATSASLEDTEKGREFLGEFFGCAEEKFEIIPGEPSEASGGEPSTLDTETIDKFLSFESRIQDTSSDKAFESLADSLGCRGEEWRKALGEKLANLGIPKKLTGATGSRGLPLATSISDLPERAFSGDVKKDFSPSELESAVSGMTLACSEAADPQGTGPLLPARIHLFFRNLTGIWACSDPDCPEVKTEGKRPAGRLYTEPRISCKCGSRVLKLYYCQTCGEVFVGGYRNPARDRGDGFYLTPDFPELENLPGPGFLERTLNDYTIFWPAFEEEPEKTDYITRGQKVKWKESWLEPKSGLVTHYPGEGRHGWYLKLEGDAEEEIEAIPKYCPNCGDCWSLTKFGENGNFPSPVRDLGTGFTKVAQILGDKLLVEVSENPSERKMVTFSDSRQDAAQLARDMEHDHYLDLLRNLVLYHCRKSSPTNSLEAYKKSLKEGKLDPQEEELAGRFEDENPTAALALKHQRKGEELTKRQKQALEKTKQKLSPGTPLSTIWTDVERSLVKLGVNPAGIERWANRENDEGEKEWISAYIWNEKGDISPNFAADPDINDLRKAIKEKMINRGIQQIFAARNRSLENLGFGYITFTGDNRRIAGLPEDISRQIADSTIRILGQSRRIRYRQGKIGKISFENREYQRNEREDPSRDLAKYLKKVSEIHGCNQDELQNDLETWLEESDAVHGYLIDDRGLVLHKVKEKPESWVCPNCTRRHLHPSAGVCTDCCQELPESPEKMDIPPENYYAELAVKALTRKRLHCEELTGQTDQADFFRRLRWFQDICKKNENQVVRPIDVLNVTTTMEAGVDIGQLKMIMLANMPPERFNYQQRVGRCGRREQGLSYVLTFCKGRSHDDYYFKNLESMTSEPPPDPYLDLERKRIVERILSGEILRRAFAETGLGSSPGEKDSVHGEFGPTEEWSEKRDKIGEWIKKHPKECRHIVDVLTRGAPGLDEHQDDLVEYAVGGEILNRVDQAVEESSEKYLSQGLAWEGVLPMFGFPTGVRNLYLDRPKIKNGEWSEKSIDRNLKIAIGEFSPGSEIVRDKRNHLSVGIADYKPGVLKNRRAAMLSDNLLGNEEEVSYCNYCKSLHPDPPEACSVCGTPLSESSGKHRSITLSFPAGFRTDYTPKEPRPNEISRSYSSSARAVIPALDPNEAEEIFGTRIWIKDGKFYYINDNNGEMFDLVKIPGQGWIDKRYLDRLQHDAADNRGEVERALAAKRVSEVIVIEPSDLRPEFHLDIRDIGVRSALYSFGFMLQRATATYLDVNQEELDVGITPIGDRGYVRGRVYLADSHENGAGYAKYLSNPDNFAEVLEDISQGKNSKLLAGMKDHFEGTSECDSSCYDCLRSYKNRWYHPLLDWRLAFDTVSLLTGKSLETVTGEWLKAVDRGIQSLGPEFERLKLFGLPGVKHSRTGNISIFSHPFFWRDKQRRSPKVAEAHVEAENESNEESTVIHHSYFDIVHQPWKVAGDIASGRKEDINSK